MSVSPIKHMTCDDLGLYYMIVWENQLPSVNVHHKIGEKAIKLMLKLIKEATVKISIFWGEKLHTTDAEENLGNSSSHMTFQWQNRTKLCRSVPSQQQQHK